MVCTTISKAWARQPERRGAGASRAMDNDAQAFDIVALRVAALGFPAAMQTIPITQTGSLVVPISGPPVRELRSVGPKPDSLTT
jgi:hypothetical protein